MELQHRSLFAHALIGAASLLVAGSSAAVPLDDWGARTIVSVADCPSFCTNFTFGPTGGGVNQASAFSSVSTFQGNAQASAELDPGAGLNVPILKGEGYSTLSGQGSAFSTAFAVEGYTYTGPGSKTFNLDITLTGSVVDSTPADNDTFIRAQVYIFEPEPFGFFSDLGTLIFEVGAQEIDSTTLTIFDEINAVRQGTLSFTLATGESVYLWALLDAEAQRDLSYADAFSTLGMGFQDDGGLVAASAIPEPATFSLVALGVLGLACRRRVGAGATS